MVSFVAISFRMILNLNKGSTSQVEGNHFSNFLRKWNHVCFIILKQYKSSKKITNFKTHKIGESVITTPKGTKCKIYQLDIFDPLKIHIW